MKQGLIIFLVVAVVGVLFWFVIQQQKKQTEALAKLASSGAGARSQTECSKDWLCATTSILTGLGSFTDGISFSLT